MKLSKQKVLGVGVGVVRDPRFARLHSDPRFQRAFKRKLKIPIDSRFRHIFSDKRFSDPLALDKRGKQTPKRTYKKKKKRHSLHQYYDIDDDDEPQHGEQAAMEETPSDDIPVSVDPNPNHSIPEFANPRQNGKNPNHIGSAPLQAEQHRGPLSKKKTKKGSIASESCEAMLPHREGKMHGNDALTRVRDVRDMRFAMPPHARYDHKEEKTYGNEGLTRLEDVEGMSEEDSESEEESDVDDVSGESFETSSATSSSSEDSSEGEEMADSPRDEAEDEKVPVTETETRRLALVNMDWDHIQAVDILAVMNSFVPKGGHIVSVSVFPSEFGIQQMKEEEKRGPQGVFQSEGGDEDEEAADDGLSMERLRQYEKAKLRYFYAVVECDSSATADFLYKSCDGMEFERSSNTLDLRFIPDDMKFKIEPRDMAKEVPSDYQAPAFETRALQHSNVKLTWDDDEPDRVKTLRQKFNAEQLNEMDFKAYLASDASDGEEEEDIEINQSSLHEDEACPDKPDTNGTDNDKRGSRDKYRALLLGSDDVSEGKDSDNNDKDMEITFHSGLEELSKRLMDKNKQKGGDETVWEAYLRKKKEKRKRQKQPVHGEDDQEESADELQAGGDPYFTQHDTDFDDPFFKSGEGAAFDGNLASEGMDSDRDLIAAPVVRQKKGARAQKKAELEEKKREEGRSRAELELLFADEHAAGSGVKGYNLKKRLKGKRKEMNKIPEKLPTVNYNDPRFAALFTSHRFAVDPTEPEFRRSAAQLRSLLEKQQKHLPQVHEVVDSGKLGPEKAEDAKVLMSNKSKHELSLMVRSLKRKVGASG